MRRDTIARRLAAGQTVVAAALAAEFAVSDDAIRRDLRALAAEGRCRRTYGGALPLSPAFGSMTVRTELEPARKHVLARRAVRLIQPREVLFLDSGSTNLALAAELPPDQQLTIVTNAIPSAAAILPRAGFRLIMVGGAVDPEVGGCVDARAVQDVQTLNIDRCFLGACSVSTADGVSAFVHADATFKRALVEASRTVAVLATTDKLETRAPYRVAGTSAIDDLVVEADAPAAVLAGLRATGINVVPAESNS